MTFNLSGAVRNIKSDQLKNSLLDALRRENVSFSDIAQIFYAEQPETDVEYLEVLTKMQDLLSRILDQENWDESLFLHNAVKPLQQLRDEVQRVIDFVQQDGGVDTNEPSSLSYQQTCVFVSLYQGQGDDLGQWEMQLRSLSRYILGRPIYATEDGVKKLIRLKTVKTNEAYVKVAVNSSAIQQDNLLPQRFDRHGTELLTLMPGALKSKNIVAFVCQDGEYYWKDGRLGKKVS